MQWQPDQAIHAITGTKAVGARGTAAPAERVNGQPSALVVFQKHIVFLSGTLPVVVSCVKLLHAHRYRSCTSVPQAARADMGFINGGRVHKYHTLFSTSSLPART